MRAVLQRVSQASVIVEGSCPGAIEGGLLVYVGVDRDDTETDVKYIADKIRNLRIFADEEGKLNLSVHQARGRVLLISAFTLQADARRGRRPTLEGAATGERAFVLYEMLSQELAQMGLQVEKGVFGAEMFVQSTNAGPVCILLESRRAF